MHRFFLTDRPVGCGRTLDLDTLRHQLWRVLRMRPGDRILLLDGTGREYLTELLEIDDRRAIGKVVRRQEATGEPATFLALYQCALKGDRLEWVLQKGTELGVSRFVPVISERTIVRPASVLLRKYDRWRTIVREAAEQSGRGVLPELAQPMTWEQALEDENGARFALWEQADGRPSLGRAVGELLEGGATRTHVSLLIGPEGGIGAGEMQTAVTQGWQPVTLGPRILRAETASITAVSITMSVLGEMG
jgi:16S rRNA (uracil1498-N3)-methyltransferase